MEVNLEKQQQRGLYKSCQRPRFGGGGAPVFPPPPADLSYDEEKRFRQGPGAWPL